VSPRPKASRSNFLSILGVATHDGAQDAECGGATIAISTRFVRGYG
jgi:hypothetical protein